MRGREMQRGEMVDQHAARLLGKRIGQIVRAQAGLDDVANLYADGCRWQLLDPPPGPTVDDLVAAYADVPGSSGYTLTKNAFNNVTFTAVNTTRLRLVLTGTGTASVGLLEVRAFG